jgi:sugar (pentulose or hexulose) kinase
LQSNNEKESKMSDVKSFIESGQAVFGMELGSTRIKAVLIGPDASPLASGDYGWESSNVDGIWSYGIDEVWTGVAACFANLRKDAKAKYGAELDSFMIGGFSAMMHGYLAFDASDELLVPFRTWRNNNTGAAAIALTGMFAFPIAQRWSIAHLYQAMLNKEPHVSNVAYITTLAGYVHWKLTGRKVLGIGDASGMFPIDIETQDFDANRIKIFNGAAAAKGLPLRLGDILPEIVPVGEDAGRLTTDGAQLLDPDGRIGDGIPLCPPEGDAGTGMAATNSVRVRTGNVSAGTSVFAMLVMEKELSKVHEEIDLVTTPDGKLVGMAHSNNCTADYDAWVALFGEAARSMGADFTVSDLYNTLLNLALQGDPDCGGLLSYGYVAGEHVTGFSEGRPLFVRSSGANFSLANVMRSHLFGALCALRTGLNVLMDDEGIVVDKIHGHGGFFKTPGVGQRIMAAATRTPVSVLDTAGEGGSWGMALLAAYAGRPDRGVSLADFLDGVFADSAGKAVAPKPEDMSGFDAYFERYHMGLGIERAAVGALE